MLRRIQRSWRNLRWRYLLGHVIFRKFAMKIFVLRNKASWSSYCQVKQPNTEWVLPRKSNFILLPFWYGWENEQSRLSVLSRCYEILWTNILFGWKKSPQFRLKSNVLWVGKAVQTSKECGEIKMNLGGLSEVACLAKKIEFATNFWMIK